MHKFKEFIAVCLVAYLTIAVGLFTHASAAEEKPNPQTLFINVNIFDGKADTLAEGMSVLAEGNLIKQIGKNVKGRDDAKTIDGGGRTLMPGLIDAHTHLHFNGLAPLNGGWSDRCAMSAGLCSKNCRNLALCGRNPASEACRAGQSAERLLPRAKARGYDDDVIRVLGECRLKSR